MDIKEYRITQTIIVPTEFNQKRLDQTLSQLISQYSRTLLKSWILSGFVKVDHVTILQPKYKIHTQQIITIDAIAKTVENAAAQPIALSIIFEDQDIIAINKPVGLVVHPGAGNKDNTLLNALLYYDPTLALLPRAGIIHRLDKDTSGLLLIARNLSSYTKLVISLEHRKIKRQYEAIVYGSLISGGTINQAIGRHKTKRTKMAIIENGKPSITHYRVIERFHEHTHLKVILETGRTHQIRLHMAYINHPIIGDQVYGGRLKLPKKTEELRQFLRIFKRQALHAKNLIFTHPRTEKLITLNASLPNDMLQLLALLRDCSKSR